MTETALCELARKHGTDKAGGGYTLFYHSLLSSYRETFTKVLELGIGTTGAMQHVPNYRPGASLRMWEEYFPHAQIYGVDIEPSICFNAGRIQCRAYDERKIEDLDAIVAWVGEPNLVVDDALHESGPQIYAANLLVPYVARGGFYVIEDVSSPHIVSHGLFFPHYIVRTRMKRADTLIVIPR